jgi:cellulose synthase/poly-beta-1,6-N-acetylglucosamine synthase-like glycosyltransferase
MVAMIALVVVSLSLLAYVYGGYLLALKVVVWLRGPRVVRRAHITPSVSLIISAYNEAAVIRAKLENALALDYPAELLEVVVVSDASDDGTDEIVREYTGRGARLMRQPERRGKTAGLNAVMPTLRGEIVVFSDANAMYNSDALLKLTRNFADPDVGCVTGEARYVPGGEAPADAGERLYWQYEMQVKRLETALGSMVGGDGAIYAIRRQLWQDLPDNAINDFLNPLQIVAGGWRAIYEPEAICYEETAGTVALEYRRRIRIVSRSWRAIFQAGNVLNPFKVGIFAWSVLSHKVLRWMSGAFAALAGLGMMGLYAEAVARWPMPTLVVSGLAVAAAWATKPGRHATGMLGYFVAITVASVMGMLKGSGGRVSGVWNTPREHGQGTSARRPRTAPIGALFLAASAVLVALGVLAILIVSSGRAARVAFWGAAAILFYVFVGYPFLLALLRSLRTRSVSTAPIEPHVCLFIAANDEGAVIEAKLQNTLAVDYPADKLDIIVASDGSVDETNAIVRRFAPRVRLLEFSPRRGKIAVVNEGMRTVRSEIVVFSDANTFLDVGAIRALVRNFADSDVGAVSGDVRLEGERAALGQSEDLYYRYERWLQAAESDIGSMVGVDGALYAIRRELFVPAPDDTILDDMAIPMAVVRAGQRVIFERDARGHERGSESAREEFSRKVRVIAGAFQFLSRHDSAVPIDSPQVMLSMVSHKALRWLSPAFGACAFLASVVLARSATAYGLLAAAQLLVLALGAVGCVKALRRVTVIGLAHYFCLVQAAAAVGFIKGLSGSQSVRWRRFSRPPLEVA